MYRLGLLLLLLLLLAQFDAIVVWAGLDARTWFGRQGWSSRAALRRLRYGEENSFW